MSLLLEWRKYPASLKVWIVFIVLFPFYLFRSGLPQIADLVLAYAIFKELQFDEPKVFRRFSHVTRPLKMFVIYVCLVSIFWMPQIEAPATRWYLLLLFPLFYIYNGLAFWLALRLYLRSKELFIRATLIGAMLSVLVQLVLIPVAPAIGVRGSLFFNNPNQLGYYALLILSIFFYSERVTQVSFVIKTLVLLAICLFAAISASKAAIISTVVLIACNLIESGALRAKHFLGGLMGVLVLATAITQTNTGAEMFDRVLDRVSEIGTDNDDNMEHRGYDRIWMHPEYAILGAGEGGWERFYEDSKRRYEMHSTFGTVLFSYGIPGLLFFLLFLFRTFSKTNWIYMIYAVPCFAYGFTHMGLRCTLFWVFFAIVTVCGDFEAVKVVTGSRQHLDRAVTTVRSKYWRLRSSSLPTK